MRLSAVLWSPATVIVASVALVYFVTIGGTPFGELVGWLRVVNTLLAAAFILLYFSRAPQSSDRVDRLVLLSLLLFSVASILSAFPRQSFDALLAGLAYASIFYVARDAVANPATARVLMMTLRALSVIVTALIGMQQLSLVRDWWLLTEGTVLPPLSLPLVARPWGHAYDLLLLGLMLYPSWLVRPVGRARLVGAIVVGTLLGIVVLLLGSRAIWLAITVASVLVAAPHAVTLVARSRAAVRWGAASALGVAAVVLIVLGGPILDRLLTFATVGQRVELWAAGVEAWLARPIAGYGPGSFPWIMQTTDYFNSNSIHPRHPDSAIFQLMPEAGMVGVIAAALLLLAVAVPLVRARGLLPIWPLMLFVFAGVGMNPTDFSFLIVIAIVWAALGLPRNPTAPIADRSHRVSLRPVRNGAFAVIGVAVTATLVAGILYDSANLHQRGGDLHTARGELGAAIALDPGMALYHRQHGVASILLGDPTAAAKQLTRATRLNPSDDAAWRILAIALDGQGKEAAASNALAQAIAVQRSDVTNLLLLGHWQSSKGETDALRETLGEIVLAWPKVMAAPGWEDIVGDRLSADEVIAAAIERWEQGEASPEPLRAQPLLLAILGERPDLFDRARDPSEPSERLAHAIVAVHSCDPNAAAVLDSSPPEDRRSSTYWALRVQQAASLDRSDEVALDLYDLNTRTRPSIDDGIRRLNPLWQNNNKGAVDSWGYDRVPIAWDDASIMLPLPEAGAARLLLEPAKARAAMMLDSGPGSCG